MKNKIIIGSLAVCLLLYLRKQKLKKQSNTQNISTSNTVNVSESEIDFIRTEIYNYIVARNAHYNVYKTVAEINKDVMYITRNKD